MFSPTITSVPPAIGTTSGFAAASSSASSSDRAGGRPCRDGLRATGRGSNQGPEPRRPYTTRSSVSPCAGAICGVRPRSRAARISRTAPVSRRPSPTATSVPTRLRTIWCRNAFARAEISTRSPARAIESRSSRRTVPARRRPAGRTTRSRARREAHAPPLASMPRTARPAGARRTEPRTDRATRRCRSGSGIRGRSPRTARRTPRLPDARPTRRPRARASRSPTAGAARDPRRRPPRTTPPAPGMHPGVSPSRDREPGLATQDTAERLRQDALHRTLPSVLRPAAEPRPVVGEREPHDTSGV